MLRADQANISGDVLSRRRFVKRRFVTRRRFVTETFCYGDVLLRGRFVRRRFVEEVFCKETFCTCVVISSSPTVTVRIYP
jgi:hypothetical protein